MTRATITFDDELYFQISRLAKLQGRTKSSLINELLSSAIPFLTNTSDIIEKLQNATEEEKKSFEHALHEMARVSSKHIKTLGDDVQAIRTERQLELVTAPSL